MSDQRVEIALVSHDVAKRRSLLLLTWPDDPDRRLSLPIPYGTPLEAVMPAAEAALRTLSGELAALRIGMPSADSRVDALPETP